MTIAAVRHRRSKSCPSLSTGLGLEPWWARPDAGKQEIQWTNEELVDELDMDLSVDGDSPIGGVTSLGTMQVMIRLHHVAGTYFCVHA